MKHKDKLFKAIVIVMVSIISFFGMSILTTKALERIEASTGNGVFINHKQVVENVLIKSLQKNTEKSLHNIRLYIMKVNPHLDDSTRDRIALAIYSAHMKYSVPLDALAFIVAKESTFKVFSRNSYRSNGKKHYVYGLMQISDVHFPAIKKVFPHLNLPRDLYTPEINIEIGAWIFQQYLRLTNGDIRKAFDRYSGGWGDKYYKHKLYRLAQSIL